MTSTAIFFINTEIKKIMPYSWSVWSVHTQWCTEKNLAFICHFNINISEYYSRKLL